MAPDESMALAVSEAVAECPPAAAPSEWLPLRLLRRAAIDVEPLHHADFRRLWLGNSVAFVGFQVTAVAVPVQVFAMTASSFWVGMLGAVGLVPLVVFGLWGGAVADAIDRRRLLLVSSVTLWACTAGLLIQAVLGLDNLALLLVLVGIQAAGFAVASAARGSIIPRVLPTSSVPAANTLSFTASNLSTVLGPLLAGLVLAHWSVAAAYGLDALVFTVALYAAFRLPALPPTGRPEAPGLRSVFDGFAFIASRPVLLLSFAVDIVAMVFAMPRALFPEAAEDFGGGAAVGWLFAAIAFGSLLAGLTSGWVGRVRHQGVALTIAVTIWGIAIAFAGLATQLWVAVVLLAAAGAADLVSAVYRMTILQTYAPDEMRGRMQGVFIVVVAGGPRLGDVRAGASAAAFGVTAAWVGGGLLCAVLAPLALLVRPFRRYDARAVQDPGNDGP
jgi:MFS family permease